MATSRLVGGNAVVRGGHLALLFLGDPPPNQPAGFAAYPGLVDAQCRSARDGAGTVDWLQVEGPEEVAGRAESSRIGLHGRDYNVTLGDIAALVTEQASAWAAAHG